MFTRVRRMAAVAAAACVPLVAGLPMAAHAAAPPPEPVELVLFWGDGCPHCAAEKEFLADLQGDYPDLVISLYEVWHSAANRALFARTAAELGFEASAVPTTIIGDRVWVGFSSAVADEIRAVVAARLSDEPLPEPEATEHRIVDVPFVGEVDVGHRSLLSSTLIIAFVDGVNPCSLWVLSVLLALVLHSGSRRRVAAVGGVFLLVTSVMYGLYMVGAYSALSYAGSLDAIRLGVALVVGVLGLLQLKEAVGVTAGPGLHVPHAARPGMYARMRRLADPQKSVPALVGTTALLAAGVSLLETPCTLGLPIMWTDMLAEQEVPLMGAVLLFLLYLVVFLLDELALFLSAVLTMRAFKVQEHHGRGLKMVSGVVMLTLAVTMLWWPDAMDSVIGSLVVFAIAGVLAGGGVLVQRLATR